MKLVLLCLSLVLIISEVPGFAGDLHFANSSHEQASPPDEVTKSPALQHAPSWAIAVLPANVPIKITFRDNGNSAEDSIALDMGGANVGGYNTFYPMGSDKRKPEITLAPASSERDLKISHDYKTTRYGLGDWKFNPGRIRKLEEATDHITYGVSNIRFTNIDGPGWHRNYNWAADNDFNDVTITLSWTGARTPTQKASGDDEIIIPHLTRGQPNAGDWLTKLLTFDHKEGDTSYYKVLGNGTLWINQIGAGNTVLSSFQYICSPSTAPVLTVQGSHNFSQQPGLH